MLILAGITISALTGSELFEKAKQAEEETNIAEVRENVNLLLSEYQIEKTRNKNLELMDYFNEKENEKQIDDVVDNLDNTISVTIKGITVKIDKETEQIIRTSDYDVIAKYEITGYNKENGKIQVLIKINSELEIKNVILPDGDKIKVLENNKKEIGIDYEVIDGEENIFIVETSEGSKKYLIQTKGTINKGDIKSAEDLKEVAELTNLGYNYENKELTLKNNIDLSEICYKVDGTTENDKSWEGIGTDTNRFEGKFDGAGNTISNLYIHSTETTQGLFGTLGTNGEISNLTINGTVRAKSRNGGFAGMNYGMIEKCINNADVSTDSGNCGGISGWNYGTIYRCINNGNVTGIQSNAQVVAGIAGYNARTSGLGFIIECINNGNISTSSYTVGGIVGGNATHGSEGKGYICNCYNTGTITGGAQKRGGIVGNIRYQGGNSYIYNCYNKGNVNGGGEIIGYDDRSRR